MHSRVPAELNAFVGREEHLAEGVRLLRSPVRLVTVLGLGGIGKTRLSHKLAALVESGFHDGVCLVDLTSLTTCDELMSEVADRLDLLDNDNAGLSRLVGHLRDKQMLLVLDNCEHLLEPVSALVRTVLRAAPQLTVLATSRVKLGVPGEHQLEVPPLPAADAFTLLVDRGCAVNRTWARTLRQTGELPPSDHDAAVELSAHLDGIPLAIELAAVQLDGLTVQEVRDRIGDRFALLVGGDESDQPHHRSLRATLDVSHDLLPDVGQRMWALASVFRGGFDLEAAEAVCARFGIARAEVLPLLTALRRHSLVTTQVHDGRTRYSMLETIREYGALLISAADLTGLRHAHADYVFDLVEASAATWFGRNEGGWMRRLPRETANIRAAVDFLLADPEQAARGLALAVNTGRSRFPAFAGKLNETRRLLNRGLDVHPDEPSELQVAALSAGAWLGLVQGAMDDAEPLLRRCQDAADALGIAEHCAPLKYAHGTYLWLASASPSKALLALDVLTQAEDLFRAAGCPGDAHMAFLFRAMCAAAYADKATALSVTAALLAEAEEAGAEWAISWALWACALAELRFGEPVHAVELVQRSLRMQMVIGDTWGPAWGLWLLACIAAHIGNHALSGQLFGGSLERQKVTRANASRMIPFLLLQQRLEKISRRELGDEEYAVQVALGQAMSYRDVIALALMPFVRPAPDSVSGPGGLSVRETEVARLVAQGLGNKEIATMLNIAYRTVDKHVQNVMAKLGASNRVELTARYLTLTHQPDTAPDPVRCGCRDRN